MAGRVAIVTGGARGIGLGITRMLLAKGHRLAIWDSDEEALAALPKIIGLNADRLIAQVVNVTDKEAVVNATAEITNLWKTPDILVNNAGITRDKMFHKMEEEDWDSVLSVHLKGSFNVCRSAVKGEKGVVINTASVAAYDGQIGQAAYSASKGGIVGMTLPIARELASNGIRVNTIAPGLYTPLIQSYTDEQRQRLEKSVPMGRIGQVEDVAGTVGFLADEANSYVTGQLIYVCGGRSLSSPSV